MRRVHILVSQMSPVIHVRETALRLIHIKLLKINDKKKTFLPFLSMLLLITSERYQIGRQKNNTGKG